MAISQEKLRIRLHALRRLKSVFSPEVFIHNVPWRIQAREVVTPSKHTFEISLRCKNVDFFVPLDEQEKPDECHIDKSRFTSRKIQIEFNCTNSVNRYRKVNIME